ncbi:MAG: hypothetical protein AAB582_02580 [Patescibacteria group bacterium]
MSEGFNPNQRPSTAEVPTAEKVSLSNQLPAESLDLALDKDAFESHFEAQRTLSPDAEVRLYHGLNGSYDAALDLLTSEHKGVEERRGPTLSLTPLAQYWKPGDVGISYAIARQLVQFPGEDNPNAVVRLDANNVAHILTPDKTLPFTEYRGEVIRAPETEPDPEKEREVSRLQQKYDKIRIEASYINEHIGIDTKLRIDDLLEKARELFNAVSSTHVRDGIHDGGMPLGKFNSSRMLQRELSVTGAHVEGKKSFGDEVERLLPKIEELTDRINRARGAIDTEIGEIGTEQRNLSQLKTLIDKRNPLQSAFGPSRKKLLSNLNETYRGSDESLKAVLVWAQTSTEPWSQLSDAIEARKNVLEGSQARLIGRKNLYDHELLTYTELQKQLDSVLEMARKALTATQGR